MKMKSLATAALASAFLALATGPALADKKPGKSSDSASTGKIAKALKGKLIKVKGDKVVDHKLTGNPEYYVVYHSASW